jgi:hypothetical protein
MQYAETLARQIGRFERQSSHIAVGPRQARRWRTQDYRDLRRFFHRQACGTARGIDEIDFQRSKVLEV